MKILLISGHGAGDCGAVGNGYKEADLTRELVNLIESNLKLYAEVDVYEQSRNAYKDVCNGTFNIGKYDYVFEVHFNAFNISAYGTECFVVPSEAGITVEQAIMRRMNKYFKLRDNDNIFDGVKRTRFAVINAVKQRGMSGALLETCFIDNKNDMEVYQNNKNAIAKDIAEGIAEGFGISKKEDSSDLQCNAHIQDIGWTGYKDISKEMIGTEGQEKRLEAIQFKADNGLEIQYRVHIQNIGWQDWKNNEEVAGTEGQGLGIEAIEIKCNRTLEVQEHIQYVGWMPKSKGKEIHLGTEGKCLRLEAFRINIV